jgi:hypothetical protein
MGQAAHKVSLGFAGQDFEPGVHICQIYTSDEERQEALLQYISSGLRSGERTACFSEKIDEQALREFLGNYGISYDEQKARGAVNLARTSEVYFQGGMFDPERMLGMLRSFHADSLAEGYPAARVIGEMTPEVQHVPGGSRLLEYESRVSMLLRECPVSAVCQYDARAFDGATIMDVLKVHPLMVVNGSVVHNPFYIPPEDYLKEKSAG